jgi:hypothetical protein
MHGQLISTLKDVGKSLICCTGREIVVSSLCPALGGGPGLNPCSALEEERTAAIKYYLDLIDLAADLECGIVIWLAGLSTLVTASHPARGREGREAGD